MHMYLIKLKKKKVNPVLLIFLDCAILVLKLILKIKLKKSVSI